VVKPTGFFFPQRMSPRLFFSSVQHLGFAWFAMVMGWCGLSLAWYRAEFLWGNVAVWVSAVLGVVAACVWMALMLGTVARLWWFPEAVRADLKHPVRHVFVATMPASWVLLASVGATHWGFSWWADALWMLGSAGLMGVSGVVVLSWFRSDWRQDRFWLGMTPALFIPVVGNVLPALAGVGLGHPVWAAVQFGLAALLWPVAWGLIGWRIHRLGMWPQRLLPLTFITVAPPSVLALSGMNLGLPLWVVEGLWCVALLFLGGSAFVARRIFKQAFGMPFWGMSFPLAAFAALSLVLSLDRVGAQAWALVGLLLVSGLFLWLGLSTAVGIWQGRLLLPEPPGP
jgi:tellurite resistance protein